MAQTATVYTLSIQLPDIDRGVYENFDLRIARQPSETAEFMLEHGMIDMIVSRSDLRTTLARLLRLYNTNARNLLQPHADAIMVNA